MTKSANLIRVGQSRLIHLPEEAIEEAGLGDNVVIEATSGAIIIRDASSDLRDRLESEWTASIARIADTGPTPIPGDPRRFLNSWEAEEWEWK